MPRRRPSSRAKSSSKPRPVDRKESGIRRWNKPSDIELDEEDQFHASRDRILLDGGNEYDDDGDDEEEVLALEGMSDDEDVVGYYDGDDDMEEEEEEPPNKTSTSKSKSKSSKSKSTSKKPKDTSPQPDSEEEETWGRSKGAYYSSNAAQLDSDDEEANELEEQEALRLQAKARDAMGDDDFGLGEAMEGEVEPDEAMEDEEALQDNQSTLHSIEKESSGTLALAEDWDDVETKARVWQDVSDDEDEDADDLGDSGNEDSEPGDLRDFTKEGQLVEYLGDAAAQSPPSLPMKPKAQEPPKKKRKASASSDSTKTKTTPAAPVFDLIEPTYAPTKKKKPSSTAPADTLAAADPYGEATSLSHADLSDKHARKKSLRFHVSRIESSSSRRTNARMNAVGGDDDIPYRERRKQREVRLEREKEKKKGKWLLGMGGDDLDDVDPKEVNREGKKGKRKRDLDDSDDDTVGANGYYALIKQAVAGKKAQKKAEYEAATARPDLDSNDISGPRSITRAILKNKGLTPHRSKAVRNPRVKKRQKYEQAKKRVASQKAIYKGGIGDVSKYNGEQSGISKVVKSVQLG
ncbi:hypothetical protein BS17DRAFT_882135 [Gyrodon lividus]|nr:hypothetical protein BS17DRAFT_882135 [Gyrodon lividus]